ncbi:MAG TPA: TIGR03435 family protein [Bryobacteraceae bacterium]|nr:TIGR03435 family protein [Bryobacteraceae bacterium]
MRALACVFLGTLLSIVGLGQTTSKPEFEIADIHASPHSSNPFMSGGVLRGGRYVLHQATMVDLVKTAYGVDTENVIGGPNWLEADRFDIVAKIPPNTPPETVPAMLQSLLADRFKLVVHNDTKPLQAFVLSMGKGKPKWKEAVEGSGAPGCQPQLGGDSGPPGSIHVSCHNITMAQFATNLHQMAGGYLTMNVVDKTELAGHWDLDLNWTARGALQAPGSEGISIFDAVDKLGLKLEAGKVPTPVIVVDSVNRKPTDNPPGITQTLPPAPPAEFEVADIKPSAPGAPQRGGGFQPGGRIDLRGVPLRILIVVAWDLSPLDDLVGAPKFLDTATYDLIAKATTTTQTANTNGPPIDIDNLRMMMRKLLQDRFKLAVHYEDRPVNAYTLVANKPKLKKADPSNRSGCKTGPAPLAKDAVAEPGPPTFQSVCQNMTMTQFAEQLPTIAPIYIHNPVKDGTGLDGAYDFTFNFVPVPPNFDGGKFGVRVGPGGGGGGARPSDAGANNTLSASDPSTSMTLFDAVNRQLGLKLEMEKRPLPVLVIDHVEEKPTEN